MNRSLEVLFIPKPKKNPVTGGEIYNLKLFQFLRKKFKNVESVEIDIFRIRAKERHQILLFGLTSIVRNLFYIHRVLKKGAHDNQKTVIFEDMYHSTDLFLFNLLIRLIKKNVVIVPIVHHLYYVYIKNKILLTMFRSIETIFLNQADWIIANSEATEKSVKKLVEAKRFLVAHPGLEKKKMMGRTSRDYDCSDRNHKMLKLLTVGSVTERKDFVTLLRAIRLLVDRYGEKHFFVNVIGDQEKDKCYSAEMLDTAKALSLSKHVAFRGRMESSKLFDFYARSDIFVSTSLHEGFGMSIAEAMYNHLPIVATKCGAIPYLVQDGVNGFLVSPRDHEQLAERVMRLLDSEELRREMGNKGFEKAKEFDWNRTLSKIYSNLLEKIDVYQRYNSRT